MAVKSLSFDNLINFVLMGKKLRMGKAQPVYIRIFRIRCSLERAKRNGTLSIKLTPNAGRIPLCHFLLQMF